MLNGILDFSKIEAGKIEITPVDYDLKGTADDMDCDQLEMIFEEIWKINSVN